MNSPAPLISVLLPLQDERDAGVQCVRAWTSGQTAAAHSYEVIALAPGEDPQLEASVRPLLRPRDRWVTQPGADEYELYQRGAKEAAGEYVFITEAHCVPEPDCLQAMLEQLVRTGAPGVRGESVADAVSALGQLERDRFELALAPEKEPDHWRKVLIHSLAIRRELFVEAGGLPPRYSDFSPWVLAIALVERGHRLLYSPRPRVRHVYNGDLDHLGAHVRGWQRGRLLFSADAPADLWGPYLPALPEWEARLALSRRGALDALRAAITLRHAGAFWPALRHAAAALGGPRALAGEARIRAALAASRARRARSEAARRAAFGQFWDWTARRGALDGLAQAKPQPVLGSGEGSIDLTGDTAGWTIGLHHAERSGVGAYRWTDSLVLLKVRAPAGTQRAQLDLEPARPDVRPPGAVVAVDGRPVPARVSPERIEFPLGGGKRTIALAFNPYRPRRDGMEDRRRLGVAVRFLRFSTDAREEGGKDAAAPQASTS